MNTKASLQLSSSAGLDANLGHRPLSATLYLRDLIQPPCLIPSSVSKLNMAIPQAATRENNVLSNLIVCLDLRAPRYSPSSNLLPGAQDVDYLNYEVSSR